MNQPYQNMAAAGATGSLADVIGRMPQQGQMADIYGQGAAKNLGGAQQGMNQLAPLGGGYMNQSGAALGQYGNLQGYNQPIQQRIAQEIQDIQAGKADFDPFLTQQFGDQERLLKEGLRRQLGGDYANSSAGIEALGKFGQMKTTALGSAQFNRLNELLNQQQGGIQNLANQGLAMGQFGANTQGQQFGQGQALGQMYGAQANDLYNQAMGLRAGQLSGQNQMLNQAGQMQNLYSNIPQTMGQFGAAMSNQAGASVNAQQPYQNDRFLNAQLSYAPSSGQFAGQMMGQSGDRWGKIGSSMMGGGMGG
jgi:hypothetical protein